MTALLTTLVVAELVVLVLLSFLVLGLLRSHALILKSLHDLGAGLELDRQVEQERAREGGSPGPVPVELERGVVDEGRPRVGDGPKGAEPLPHREGVGKLGDRHGRTDDAVDVGQERAKGWWPVRPQRPAARGRLRSSGRPGCG